MLLKVKRDAGKFHFDIPSFSMIEMGQKLLLQNDVEHCIDSNAVNFVKDEFPVMMNTMNLILKDNMDQILSIEEFERAKDAYENIINNGMNEILKP